VNTFTFTRAESVADATRDARENTKFVAGGTTLIDLMKLNVETPAAVIDINRIALAEITRTPEGGLRIGALARNADVAHHPDVVKDYPVLSQALLSGASAQLRNMASTGGNLLQRTRCVYFRDTASACNKRSPGSGCAAIGGFNRNLAILGTSDRCIATNPSDQNVALTALEATVQISGASGERSVPIGAFYLLPGETPERETILEPGELVTSVTLPAPAPGATSTYLKLRDRASYEFALASAAVVATVREGTIERVRIAMGGIGTKPWRNIEAEVALEGKSATPEHFANAARILLRDAKPQSQNGFKLELAKRCLVHALTIVTAVA
jgi:xanthine dehydrogenase YagS FAD-binding subunit